MNDGHLLHSIPASDDVRPERAANVASRRRMSSEVEPAHALARECADLLEQSGPIAVLRVLNARTRFRFSGIYHADPPFLRNLFMYDRENPTLNVSGDVSRLDETYCSLVWADERPFVTESAATDVRLVTHAARECVRSYCGVPIRCATGRVWGTLCHYDVRPRLLPAAEVRVLELVGSLLASRLADPPLLD